MDRKNYSPRREDEMKRVIRAFHDEFAARCLRGDFSAVERQERDRLIREALFPLSDLVAAEYRRYYVPRGSAADDKTMPLFDDDREAASADHAASA